MAKVTIYLPDDLAERVRAAGVSMSPVCQAALEKEVKHVTNVAELHKQMGRIEVNLRRPNGEEGEEYMAAFTGRWLVEPSDDNRYTENDNGAACGIAVTGKDQIAVYTWHVNGGWGPALEIFDSLGDAQRRSDMSEEFLAQAAEEMGEDFVSELDI